MLLFPQKKKVKDEVLQNHSRFIKLHPVPWQILLCKQLNPIRPTHCQPHTGQWQQKKGAVLSTES